MITAAYRWIDRNILELGREMRLSYLPPLGQIAMIPMLAWIANSAPANLKATYFAVMASFTNLALSLSQLGSKYLNQVFIVTCEIREPATGALQVHADYSQLGTLLIVQTCLASPCPSARSFSPASPSSAALDIAPGKDPRRCRLFIPLELGQTSRLPGGPAFAAGKPIGIPA